VATGALTSAPPLVDTGTVFAPKSMGALPLREAESWALEGPRAAARQAVQREEGARDRWVRLKDEGGSDCLHLQQ
jgi:hypothetical protein